MTGPPAVMTGGAHLSDDGAYRYTLTRLWDGNRSLDAWIMLNPSTADAETDDPTIRRCLGFSRAWGAGGIAVVNLFALRSTDPVRLRMHPDPVGPENDAAVAFAVTLARRSGGRAVAAWGAQKIAFERSRLVYDLVGGPLVCLGQNYSGSPRHPLYVPGDTLPLPWRP